ncbi:MAG: glycoside hydrolase family 92 protein [Roseiflexaceae bacterium]|nr:glycoside hydrolase family 92 protein [Roseiflexaceae bacterium]
MSKKTLFAAMLLFALLASFGQGGPLVPSTAQAAVNLTQYVNPLMGTKDTTTNTGENPTNGAHGARMPSAQVPFGMIQWGPDTNTSDTAISYDYDNTTLRGFSLIKGEYMEYWSPFLPYVGSVGSSPGTNASAYHSTFSHANETAAPGYYRVQSDSNITTELTNTSRAGQAKFTYPAGAPATLIVSSGYRATIDPTNRTITGSTGNTTGLFFVARFDRSFSAYGTFAGSSVSAGSTSTNAGNQAGAYVTFDTASGSTVQARLGVSWVSVANAQANLDAEIPNGQSFETTRSNADSAWNTLLNRFLVEDANAQYADLRTFYTTLYHFASQPNVISDLNGQYTGWDSALHTVASGHAAYTTISNWDGGRGQWSLLGMLFPKETSDAIQTYTDSALQVGDLSQILLFGNAYRNNPNVPDWSLPAQAHAFGATAFDTNTTLGVVWEKAQRGRSRGAEYLANGYVGGTGNGDNRAVEITQNNAIADFDSAQMALNLGDYRSYKTMIARSNNWANVWCASCSGNGYNGYLWSRGSNGGGFDSFGGPTGGNETLFEESVTAQGSWRVPHNTAELIGKMGGTNTFRNRLDNFYTKLSDGPVSTYSYFGNQPSFQTPWLYNWAGQPAKTQRVVRQIQLDLFSDQPDGYPGNEDWGAMSAWYVGATMGLHPAIPSVPGFAINSPMFAKLTITLQNGRTLTIEAPNAARTNQYIQSATLNGSSYDSPWVPLASLVNGNQNNTLRLTLGSSATSWGSAPSTNQPPSYGATPVATPTDIAQGKTTTASSECGSNEIAANTTDDNDATKWCAGGTGAVWLKVDLGANATLNSFVVRHAGYGAENVAWNTRDYQIQWSANGSDGGTWNTLVDTTDNVGSISTHTISSIDARWVRLNITKGQQNGATTARIYAFEIYGTGGGGTPVATNLALNSAASALNSCGGSEGPEKAVNGSVSGGNSDKWCATLASGSVWLQVDLGAAKPISRWVVRHAGAGGESASYNSRDFKLQQSSNATNWSDLDSVSGNSASVTDRAVAATSARYWRLLITAPEQSGGNVARIYEFELYGTGSNLALNKTATADSQCGSAEGPAKAVNGSVSGGNSDKWCSAGGSKFLQIDLGASASITRLVVKHAGAGGENTAWNTRAFTIQLSNDNGANWSTPVNVTNNTASETSHTISATAARLVRLNIVTPASDGNGAARIYELEVYDS